MEANVTEQTTEIIENGQNVAVEIVDQTKNLFHFDELTKYFTFGNLIKIVLGVLTIIVFYILYRIIKKLVLKKGQNKLQPHTMMLITKFIKYGFWILIAMYVLSLFGIKLSAIWGAAGVAGLAIGFAAQTSVSNMISGLFVLSEHSLKVGDYISVGGESGIVDNIGLLSVRMHTLDNQSIRIPNSTIINSNLENYNSFNTRRFVFKLSVSYNTDLQKALDVLCKVPEMCPSVLKDPAPLVFYDGIDASGVVINIAVWFKNQNLVQVKNEMYINIIKITKEEKIEIPYDRFDVTLLNGSNRKETKKVVKKSTAAKGRK